MRHERDHRRAGEERQPERDIHRGIDVLSWTGTPNPTGAQAPASASGATTTNLSLLGVAGILLPIAALVGRRRRAAGHEVTPAG